MISALNRITSKRRTRMGKTKRRCGAWIVTLALLLSLLPTSALAAGQTIYTQTGAGGDGSSARPYANFEQALAAAKDGDTIVVRGKSTLNEKENGATIPCVINKAITIQGEGDSAALNVRTAGIVLGADVTITNIELNFANKYHNAIFANGHRFTAINVTRGSGSRVVHLFAGTIGAATGLNFTATAGTNAAFTLQNSEFGNIYAGSVADNSSVRMNVDISNSKAIGNIYGSGAQEKTVSEDDWFDMIEPAPPVADTTYAADDATVTVDGSAALTVDGSGAKSMNVIVNGGKNRQMTLKGVTALTAQGGQVKVASINENAHVTLLDSAELDISGATTGTDVKLATLTSSNGTGKLILGKSHLLTIDSTMKGTFALETPDSFQNASGEAEYDHTYIKAFIAKDATVNFTPHSTQSTMQLVKIPGDGTAWTTWKTTAAPTVPDTVSKFETTASSVSTDSDALQNGGITIPVTWESSDPDSPFKSLSAIPFHYAVTYNGARVESVDTENGGMYESSVRFTNGSFIWITAGDANELEDSIGHLNIVGNLSAGIYTITIYAPKADSSKIQQTLTLTVTDGTEAATATELAAPAADTQYTENDSVTLTAKVTSNGQPVGKGEVVFWINGTALGAPGQIKAVTLSTDGTASTTVNASAANHFKINETNTIKASYRGVPGDYDASESAEVTITVSRAATPTYTLHFDVNGGAANPAIPDQKLEVNAKPVKPADPARTGYTFLGWKTGDDFVDWNTFTMPEANVTFIAAWEANTYTIRYDANSETTTPASIAPQQYVYDTADAKLTASVFASDTKDFLGWSLSNTATTASYTKESLIDDVLKAAMVSSVDNTVTLYAVWQDKPVADVTVTFDAQTNGGELADDSAATQTGKPGMNLTLPSVKDRIGFNFTGWWTASADGIQITAPAVFPNANATYFAQWAEKAAVEVTFTSGDGVWNDNTTGTKNASTRPGIAATVPGTVSRAGYTFEGWQSDNNAYRDLPANAEKTDMIKEGQAVHYTPKWRANTYSIHFEKNSPDATGTVNPIEYIYDMADVKLTTEVFTSPTHKMLGWSLDRTADTASYASGAEIDETLKNAMVNSTDGTVTLYAIWADKDAVTMTFNAGEGFFADNSKEKIESVLPGQQNTLPAAPTRDGYTFNGWASGNADYPDLAKDATQTPVAEDGKNASYTAKWIAKTYTIHFDANGQQDAQGTVSDQSYVYDTQGAALSDQTFSSPTKKFLGWSLTTVAATASYRSGDAIDDALKAAMIASQDDSITLYAIWADKDAVTMTFNAGEGFFADNSKEKIESVLPGQQNTLPAAPTRDGYTFNGWASGNADYPDLAKDATQTPVAEDGKNASYTAKWIAKTYTIHFDANGQQDAQGTVSDQSYVYDTQGAALSDQTFSSPTKKFLGWSLTTVAATASYRSGDAIDDALKAAMIASQDDSITLYAIWAEKDAVSMTFNAGEGAFADNSKEKIESVRPSQQNPLPAAPTRDGYTFNGWASDSVDYPGLSKDATQTPVAIDGKNVTYTAKWVKNPTTQYTVTFRSGSNGSFTNANDPLISQNVESGKTVTGTPDITADRNYRFTGWQIGGAGTVYTRAQVMAMAITDDTVFIASYTYNGGNSGGGGGSVTGYVIKASAGANGSIRPSGSVSVSAGGNKTFTIMANAGYKISNVLVDGKSVGAVDSYMFEKVRVNHTIEVLFAKEGGVEDPKISGVADWLNTEEHVAFMTGYENGTFGAENAVTRAQVAQMFFNLLKDKAVRITVNFADVGANAWYAKAVNTLGGLGIVSGVGDKCFDPNRAITRAEFTAIAARFAKANETGSVRFSDVPVNAWYYNAVLTAVNYGWITGVGDNRFAPGERITRAEAATIVNRMLARSADKAYVDATALRQFPDLSTSHWAYYQIMEASNAHGHRTNADGSESWTNLH